MYSSNGRVRVIVSGNVNETACVHLPIIFALNDNITRMFRCECYEVVNRSKEDRYSE